MSYNYEELDKLYDERLSKVPSVEEMANQIESQKRKEQDEQITKLK